MDGANQNDFKLAPQTLASVPVERPVPTDWEPRDVCSDKGYDCAEVRGLIDEFTFAGHIRGRSKEAADFKRHAGVIPSLVDS